LFGRLDVRASRQHENQLAPSLLVVVLVHGSEQDSARDTYALQRMFPTQGIGAFVRLLDDYRALVPLLQELGFEAVAFSYPQRSRLGSSSLAWSDDSALMKFTDSELVQAFEAVDDLRNAFPVNNPRASVADMKRHLLGEHEHFVCYGGFKSFYMDWNFDIWRCDAWREPMCSVWEFAQTPLVRDGCTACIVDCYRDSSVMRHFAVSLGDALDLFGQGDVVAALRTLVDRRNLESLGAVIGNAPILSRLAKVR